VGRAIGARVAQVLAGGAAPECDAARINPAAGRRHGAHPGEDPAGDVMLPEEATVLQGLQAEGGALGLPVSAAGVVILGSVARNAEPGAGVIDSSPRGAVEDSTVVK
jgi:hypothetical protein